LQWGDAAGRARRLGELPFKGVPGLNAKIKDACEQHLPGILAIYNHAVVHTTAIWNETTVDLENRHGWWRGRVEAGFPVLVALDEARGVLGYASYGPFRAFDGYRGTAEHSVYVVESARRQGVGERACGRTGGAGARCRTPCPARRHCGGQWALTLSAPAVGFAETGRLPEVGQKFGRWLDLVFMQKVLRP
jgi:phosphinothricin acetyltransferase